MGKTLWHTTMSLDGFIAGPGDDMSWLRDHVGPNRAVATVSAAAGEGYVAVLGAKAAKACLTAGVLEEILVHVAPLLLGDGVRMFDHPGGANVRLERRRLTQATQVTNLWFRVTK